MRWSRSLRRTSRARSLGPAGCLQSLHGTNAEYAADAQRELESALEAYGAISVFVCAEGDVSAAALRAITASIRSLERNE